MSKIKPILQQYDSDCGCACIATILQYYGKSVRLRKIREVAGTDGAGTSGIGIVKASEEFGMSCTGVYIAEKESESKGFFARFLILLKPYKKYLIETFIASILLSAFGIFLSLYFRIIIDEVLYSEIKSTLNLLSLCYLLVVLMQTFLNYCRSQLLNYLGSKIDVCLVSDFYLHLLKLPLDFFTKRKTGEILSRVNDANTIRNAISSTLLAIVMDSVMILLGGIFMVKMGSILLLVSIVPVIISSIIVLLLKNTFKKTIKEQASLEAEKNASMYETFC